MHFYEYLFAGLIIIAMLVGSAYMMTTLSSPARNASDKNQLKITAEKIMTQMLLDSGYPYNWGSTGEVPQVFGLARYGQTSRQAYELDPDKVMRLQSSIDASVPPSLAVSLLNLANERDVAEYGFTLEFAEPLKISYTTPEPGSDETYSITVKSDYNLFVIGAKVSATLYYINTAVSPPKIDHKAAPTPYPLTGYDGSCTFTFGPLITTAKVLAITVDYYGTHVTKLFQITPGPIATLFQSRLVPDPSQPYNVASGADAREVILIHNDNGYETSDFAVQNTGAPTNFALNAPPEIPAVAVLAISGDKLLLADRDFSQIKYSTSKDPNTRPATIAYSIERTAIIDGSTYTITLYLWRMSM